jgi:hypothetical protein
MVPEALMKKLIVCDYHTGTAVYRPLREGHLKVSDGGITL